MQYYIAHRGNCNGPNPTRENSPDYIDEAIAHGFHAEVDVRLVNGEIYLGHDKADYKVNTDWLLFRKTSLWCHAKDLNALAWLLTTDLRVFWHQNDDYTIASNGKERWAWAYPLKPLCQNSICVMPEWSSDFCHYPFAPGPCVGVCSDHVASIRAQM